MARAGIPPAEREARALQLQGDAGLYADSPDALLAALTLYGR